MSERSTVGIRDVARHLNMSISTVSRALNGRPDASLETRERVRLVAAQLGYFANHFGRTLRSGVTGSVGFVIRTSHSITGQGDTFFMGVFDGLQSVFSRHQLDLMALLCPSREDPDEYLRRVVSRGIVDALVISNTQRTDPRISFLASRGVPFVALGRSETDAGHPWIDIDFEDIARKAVNRLVARGHQEIAIALPQRVNFAHIFHDSARRALKAHGLSLHPENVLRASASEVGGYAIGKRLSTMRKRPTAIAIPNEAMTSGVYRGLQDGGCLPGRDMAVIGRDSPNTRYLFPTLTSFHVNLHELGVAVGEALLAVMPNYQAQYPFGVVRKVVRSRLLQGESDKFVYQPIEGKAQRSPRR